MSGELRGLAIAVALSKAAMRKIRQNVLPRPIGAGHEAVYSLGVP